MSDELENRLWQKKPVVIEAEHFDQDKKSHLSSEFREAICDCTEADRWHIHTLEGPLHVTDGDWIIRGVQGEFYPCKPDIFEETYQKPDAASLRARPQEPGLSKEWLDELIEGVARNFSTLPFDEFRRTGAYKCLAELRDLLLDFQRQELERAPSLANSKEWVSRAVEALECEERRVEADYESADYKQGTIDGIRLAKLRIQILAPSGPLSDPEATKAELCKERGHHTYPDEPPWGHSLGTPLRCQVCGESTGPC